MTYYIAEIRFNRKSEKQKRDKNVKKHKIKRLLPLILALTLLLTALLTVSIVFSSNKSDIIESLEELSEAVSTLPNDAFKTPKTADSHRDALCNKIKAVINQIEAGAFNGALNKLSNDMKKSITEWVDPTIAADLIKMIDEIIDLIKEVIPPTPDFSIEASPESLTIEQGGMSMSTIAIESLNGFSQPVHLDITSLPITGVTTTLDPQQVTPPPNESINSTLTVEVASTVIPATYAITVTGTNDSLEHSTDISLTVTPTPPMPDFSMDAYPASLIIPQGGTNASIITVASLEDFNQIVDLAVTSEPITGVTVTLNPSQVIPPPNNFVISILTVDVASTVTVGSYSIIINGTSNSLQHSIEMSLYVTTPPVPSYPDFSLAAFPSSLTIQTDHSATSTIVVISLRDFSEPVDLIITSESIQGVNVAIYPPQVTPPPNSFATSTLTVDVAEMATLGTYTITVTGTNNTLQHKVDVSFEVVAPPAPDFSIVSSPNSLTIYQGTSDTSSLIVSSLNGFHEPVDLVVTSVPIVGVTLTLNPSELTPPPNDFAVSTLTIDVEVMALPGEYEVTIVGTSVTLEHGVDISLRISIENTPPEIVSVFRLPEVPHHNDSVTVLAAVTDAHSGVKNVVLGYSNGSEWKNVTMTLKEEELYEAGISAFSFSTLVEYRVYASDNAENWASSSVYSYIVSDPYPPSIGVPSWWPEEPGADDDVTVNVTVTEPPDGSGVKNVTLSYNVTGEWQSLQMTLANVNWTTTIPRQSLHATVVFYLEAYDVAGNSVITTTYEYTVRPPTGWPLAWLTGIALAVAALTGTGIYALYRRKKKSAEGNMNPKNKPIVSFYVPF